MKRREKREERRKKGKRGGREREKKRRKKSTDHWSTIVVRQKIAVNHKPPILVALSGNGLFVLRAFLHEITE